MSVLATGCLLQQDRQGFRNYPASGRGQPPYISYTVYCPHTAPSAGLAACWAKHGCVCVGCMPPWALCAAAVAGAVQACSADGRDDPLLQQTGSNPNQHPEK